MVNNIENSKVLEIQSKIKDKGLSDRFIMSIDGPCTAGKTTLAEALRKEYGYNIVHMDDFYLPFQYRDKDWMNIIAGHMDFVRLVEKVLKPYVMHKETEYVSYDCHSCMYLKEISIDLDKPIILEGSYSSHPCLDQYVDLKVYMDIDEKTQKERLEKRNPSVVDKFLEMWVPFENNYFRTLKIKETSDVVL